MANNTEDNLRVLAVADPAVSAYTDIKYGVLKKYGKKVQFNAVPWADYISSMQNVFAGKEAYDIIMVAGHLWLCDFVNKGYLEILDYEAEDILPSVLDEMTYEGKKYLSPSFFDGHIVVYRKSIVKDVFGKEFPMIITPQEYCDAAKKLAGELRRPSIAMKADISEILVDALPFMRMNGGDVYEGEDNHINGYDDKVVRGLEEYLKLKECALPGVEHFGNEEVAEAIRKNAVPLAITWSGQMGAVYTDECFEKDDLGFSALSNAWNVSWAFAVSSNSQKKEEAKDFLKFLRSSENDMIVGKVCGAPVRQSSYGKDLPGPWAECQLEMMKLIKALPDMPHAGIKNEIYYEEVFKAFVGEKTAREAMLDVKKRVENFYNKN